MKLRLRAPGPALVISLIALFVALGGSIAYAGGLISGRQIANHSIPANKLTAAAINASMGLTCSARDTRNELTVRRGNYFRYCGPSRAVLRVDGRVFLIKHGNCSGDGVGFGLLGYGGSWPHGKGMWLRLQPAGTDEMFWPVRAGRYSVIDGEVQMPGYGSLPHTGRAIVAKHGKTLRGTFSLGSPANPVTGRFTCR
jgi:hypothetical protein